MTVAIVECKIVLMFLYKLKILSCVGKLCLNGTFELNFFDQEQVCFNCILITQKKTQNKNPKFIIYLRKLICQSFLFFFREFNQLIKTCCISSLFFFIHYWKTLLFLLFVRIKDQFANCVGVEGVERVRRGLVNCDCFENIDLKTKVSRYVN